MFNLRTRKLILTVIVSLGAAFGSGFGYGFSKTISSTNPHRESSHRQFQFRQADYERLKIGMTLTDVQALLGQGTEIKQSVKVTILEWKNSDKSKIAAVFENGKLTSKEQFGLN